MKHKGTICVLTGLAVTFLLVSYLFAGATNKAEITKRRKKVRQPDAAMNLPLLAGSVSTFHLILGGEKYGVGYYDPVSKTIFQWRGFDLKWEQVPGHDWVTRRPPILDATDLQYKLIVLVDPLVQYAVVKEDKESGKKYLAPGHAANGHFYQWMGILIEEKNQPRRMPPGKLPLIDLKKRGLTAVPFEPAVKYYVEESFQNEKNHPVPTKVSPGYFDHTQGAFYRWGGVKLDVKQLNASGKAKILQWPWIPSPRDIETPKDYKVKLKADLAKKT